MKKILLVLLVCAIGACAQTASLPASPSAIVVDTNQAPVKPKECWLVAAYCVGAVAPIVSAIPRPFLWGGLDLGNGPAYVVGAGLMMDSKHFLFKGEVSHDSDGKSDDNVNVKRNGYNNYFEGSAYYRLSNSFFFGGGAQWNKETTAKYTKEGWHPTVGVGVDAISPFFSARLQVDYTMPLGSEHVSPSGCTVPKGQCTSDASGPVIGFYLPSPKTNSHVFARFQYGIWRAHATVTSTNRVLTLKEESEKIFFGDVQMTVMFRF